MSTLTDIDASSDKTLGGDSIADSSEADGEVKRTASKSKLKTERPSSHYKHIYPVHNNVRTSCLSRDSKAPLSFVGFKHLMVLMLFVSNLRLILENHKKYGVLICVRCHDYRRQDLVYGSLLYLLIPCHLFVAYIIEYIAAQGVKNTLARRKREEEVKKKENGDVSRSQSMRKKHKQYQMRLPWALIAFAHAINASLNLVVTSAVVYYHINHPGIGTICEMHAVIVWLKVCSYAFTNRDLRQSTLQETSEASSPVLYKTCPYPRNITVGNLVYFWWAPTLVYQPVYPRTEGIRWTFVAQRVGEVICLSFVIWLASAQYAVPLLQNSVDKVSTQDVISIAERLMKLSTISLFCWLAGFYAVFQSFLNALAEVTQFGDREFYTDWWNSESIRRYWSTWNKPVYHFMKRHIYSPLVGRGVPTPVAQAVVYVFSGFLHELLVGVPTHNILGVAFLGMMGQIPLILMTDPLQRFRGQVGRVTGNVIFWVSFCLVGQPLAVLLYFFAWHAKYGSVSKMSQDIK